MFLLIDGPFVPDSSHMITQANQGLANQKERITSKFTHKESKMYPDVMHLRHGEDILVLDLPCDGLLHS